MEKQATFGIWHFPCINNQLKSKTDVKEYNLEMNVFLLTTQADRDIGDYSFFPPPVQFKIIQFVCLLCRY